MSRTVFVLGAGASHQAGAPLMRDFLDSAEDLLRSGKVGDAKEDFELVFRGISSLQTVHSKSALDIENLEAVFAAFEMAGLFERLGTLSPEEVRKLDSAIRRLIVRTLEMRIDYKITGPPEAPKVRPPEPHESFVTLVYDIGQTESAPAVITFNYDVTLDYGFFFKKVPIHYELDDLRAGIPVLKLHGSLNWGRCRKCGKAQIWSLSDFFSRRSWPFADVGDTVRLDITRQFKEFRHCDEPVEEEPLIVPPTWSKTRYYEQVAGVWRAAARHFSEAENIFVIGYSLPPTDEFFRYLYALGTVGSTRLKRVWVLNPDGTGLVERRFRRLLGPAARTRFRYLPEYFHNAIGMIRTELRIVGRT